MKINFLVTGVSLILLSLLDFFTKNEYCSYSCLNNYDGILLNWLVFLVLNLFFLVLIFLIARSSYKKWWSFSKYASPLVIIIISFISLGVHHNPIGQLQNIFDIPILITVYLIFILGSIIQIIRGYQSKNR